MAIIGAAIVVGCLVAIILLSAFYIFPNIICGSLTNAPSSIPEGETKDPIREICKVIR